MKPVLITGGAGFIGTNLAHRLLSDRHPLVILDNLARPGVEDNLRWLRAAHGDGPRVEIADVRDAAAVRRAAAEAGQVFHLAGQVAVTSSLADPVGDFEVNARGTLTVLEAVRAHPSTPPLVFTSTNKVYGALEDVMLQRRHRRYEPIDPVIASRGVNESHRLDFRSPYGCSKGSADQYVLDYARSYGLPTIVFRMSCIYGPHQHGTEDQGWVAHFLMQALEDREITIYGDGCQVRDLLFVDDLVDALLLAQTHMPTEAGQAFNIGGGPGNSVSVLELLDLIAELTDRPPRVSFDGWRVGDQRYYVSDTAKFTRATGWRPSVHVREGLAKLASWLRESGRLSALAGHAADARR